MSPSLILAAAWALLANLLAALPSRDRHRQSATALIATGIPLLGYVTWQNGPWIGLIVLLGAMSVLRWPLIWFLRRLGRTIRGAGPTRK